ncbi:uncharacterized protein TRIADDRAFT_58987 [Trichoplax adhaerens]|uniref:AB hydrolase-1 domain-containing protein n=1 Tax=Trichoplax adhaerens TaxID=10228 RepID=B3S480_TRIAD|nr:hypothetical protein TRIADDRAFT_58987 [Trichoplax adhaerens]EDV22598.1 hypothetical protein TRIADDRAFT_58987 [Trichoplax adhaerens]|eukprot:XP_002115142.1 hypothetical protein TRIADDRAFT_58987 [Trichoplax adhaerens]
MCSSFDYAFAKRAFRSKEGGFQNTANVTDEDIEAYKYNFSRPGRLTAAINYYRAKFFYPPKPSPEGKLKVPTLVIWGEADPVLEKEMNNNLSRYVENVTYRGVAASHWVQQDEPAQVNQLMRTFLERKS